MQKQKKKRSFLTTTILMAAILFMIAGTAVKEVKAQEPFIGEIRMVGFNFAPRGWAKCDGQLLPISQYNALFSLLGTQYGGDGRTTFGLPDLRGRFAMHQGSGSGLTTRVMGQKIGTETETLTIGQIPSHDHTTTSCGASQSYASSTTDAVQIANVGGGQAHNNMPPFQVVNYVIALEGLYPSRN